MKDSLGESGFSYVGWIICGQAFVNEKEKQDELKRSIESQLECIRLFMEKGPDVIPSSSLGKKEVKISIFNILTLKYFVALYLNWRYKKIPTFTDAEIRKWSESSK